MAGRGTRDIRKLARPPYLCRSAKPLACQTLGGIMTRITLAIAASLLAAPALAATPVQVGHFNQVELNGGGHVTIRHGAQQSVTLVKGSTDITKFRIKDGDKLVIDACPHDCPMGRYDLEVEIVTPDITAAAIDGGGHIVAENGFPARDRLAAAVG